jgi:HK97 family phage portal protein
MFDKARMAIGAMFLPELKSMFNVKNPAPLIKWGADLLMPDGADNGVTKPYKQSIWVWRCLQIWQNIAQVPMILKDSKGNEVSKGAIPFLLDTPAPQTCMSQLLERMILSVGLSGEWFLLKDHGETEKGIPTALNPYPSCAMCLRQGDVVNGVIQYWSIKQNNGSYKRVPAAAVIYDRFPNPYDPLRGISPLDAASDSVNADFFSRRHNKHQMKTHGRISGMVTFKDDMQEDTLKRFSQMWNEKYEGAENAGKTAFMGSGAEYQQLAMTSKDMDWVNGMDITREEICAAFGISTIVAGGLKGATFSNYEQAMKAAWEETLMPIGNRITNILNRELIRPNLAGHYVEFDFLNHVSILQEDQNERVDKYIKLVSTGKMTPKQAATICQIDLGDPNPAHDVIWVTASELPADAVLSEPMDDNANDDPIKSIKMALQDSSSLLRPEGSRSSDSCVPPFRAVTDGGASPEPMQANRADLTMKKALVRSNLRQIIGYERKMERTLKAYFYEQRRSVLERLAESQPPTGKAIELKKIDESWIINLLNGDNWNAKMKKRMMPLVRAVAELGARQVIREVNGRFEPVVLEKYLEAQMSLMQKVNASTAHALQLAADKVLEAAVTGQTTTDLMNELKTAFKGVYNNTEARRALIARTETTRAMNGGRNEQMVALGAPLKQWISIMDGNVRESHADLDGKIVGQDEEFAFGLRFPGDPAANVAETANCRCSVIPIFDRRDVE